MSKPKRKKSFDKKSVRWALRMLVLSCVITIALTLVSTKALNNANLFVSFLVLIAFVVIGVAFDMFGIATATASESPFHAMATRRVNGAFESLRFIRSADKVSSFCNDVVGDICGIISGTSSVVIVTLLIQDFSLDDTITALAVSGLLAGMTIGGKALCKPIAMRHNTQIVLFVGRVIFTYKQMLARFRKKP